MNTQTVVHIVDGEVVRAEVPTDWILCSISGEYRPPEEYRNAGEAQQSRTNCTRTYLMPIDEMMLVKALIKKLAPAVAKMSAAMYKENKELKAGLSIAECIAMLQEFAAANPNARIVDNYDRCMDIPCINQVDGFKNLYTIG
jgi:hypothetical protein